MATATEGVSSNNLSIPPPLGDTISFKTSYPRSFFKRLKMLNCKCSAVLSISLSKDNLPLVDGLNIYNILEPCYHATEAVNITESYIRLPSSFRKLGETEKPFPVRKRMFGRAWPLRAPVRDGIVPTWPQLTSLQLTPPCTDDELANEWLNNEEVRKAIHVAQKSVISSWEICTEGIVYYHDAGSMISYHKNLTSKGYRALIYSGDHDLCVPYTGSEAWTRSIGYKIVDEWRPWSSNGQVAGYTQGYDKNLTFLTIKGSGHTVPEYKPREALDFYKRFLAGLPI